MASIRRHVPHIVIVAISLVVALPFLLLLREDSRGMFPQTPWNALTVLSLKSMVLPAAGALLAAGLALAIVVTGYVQGSRILRRVLFISSAIPFLFPRSLPRTP